MSELDEAVAEAYAAAPADVVVLETLELRHPALVDENDQPSPIRVVCDFQDRTFKLEEHAPLSAGETVVFRGVMIEVDRPDAGPGGPQARVSIQTVDREVIAALEEIVTIRAALEVTYRAYIAVPEGDPPPEPGEVIEGLKARAARADQRRMSAVLTFDTLSNRAFPGLVYTRERFPGL